MKNIHMITYLTEGNTFAIKISPCDTAWKGSKCGVFWGSYFPAFGLNAEKIRTSQNSVSGHISHSESQYL